MSEHLKKYEKDQHRFTNMIDCGRELWMLSPLPQSLHLLIRKTIKMSQRLFQRVAGELSSRDTSECFYSCKLSSKNGTHENPCCRMRDGARGGVDRPHASQQEPEPRTHATVIHRRESKYRNGLKGYWPPVFDSFGWLYNDKLSIVLYIIYIMCNVYCIICIIVL